MTFYPPLACLALKRNPLARGTRVPRAPSIVGWFFPQPWLASAAGSVGPPICHIARAAAQALLAVLCADAQNDSRRATTPDGSADVETAVQWPRSGERALLRHVGRSNSRAQ